MASHRTVQVDKCYRLDSMDRGVCAVNPSFYASVENAELKAELSEALGRDFATLPDYSDVSFYGYR